MNWKATIIYILYLFLMVIKTHILANLVIKYCIDWAYIVGQLDAILTIVTAKIMGSWWASCTVK